MKKYHYKKRSYGNRDMCVTPVQNFWGAHTGGEAKSGDGCGLRPQEKSPERIRARHKIRKERPASEGETRGKDPGEGKKRWEKRKNEQGPGPTSSAVVFHKTVLNQSGPNRQTY